MNCGNFSRDDVISRTKTKIPTGNLNAGDVATIRLFRLEKPTMESVSKISPTRISTPPARARTNPQDEAVNLLICDIAERVYGINRFCVFSVKHCVPFYDGTREIGLAYLAGDEERRTEVRLPRAW